VPRLLPSQIVATLKAGEELGDVARVIPACRTLLKDGISKTWAALHYLPLLIVVVLPMTFFILVMLQVFIWPKLVEISAGMGTAMPLGSFWIIRYGAWIDAFLLAMIGGLGLASVCFIGGPRLVSWTRLGLEPLVDRFYYCLPWHRKRLHRDFAGVLSVLLDAEVPEEKAVAIAASSTVNRVIIHRATRVCEALKQGWKLPEALEFLDDSREFRWHLANAAQGRETFWTALAGWRESLDAKAFQQEQAAAQLLTSLLIVANGVIVGLVVSSVFLFLISIIDEGILW
jgi:type II secretory pathway component PulF